MRSRRWIGVEVLVATSLLALGVLVHVRSGKLKAIGIAASKRHPLLPAVRTLAEQGLPGVDTSN